MRKKIKRTGRYFVYIVECNDATYYTGYTNDLQRRIKEHNNSKRRAKYLRGKLPVKVVWSKKYRYFRPAFLTEKRIKDLTRKQKETLIRGKRLNKVLIDAGVN